MFQLNKVRNGKIQCAGMENIYSVSGGLRFTLRPTFFCSSSISATIDCIESSSLCILKVESEGSGFSRLDHGDTTIFALDFSIEWIPSGRFNPSDITIFPSGGIFPNCKVGEFGKVPSDGGC